MESSNQITQVEPLSDPLSTATGELTNMSYSGAVVNKGDGGKVYPAGYGNAKPVFINEWDIFGREKVPQSQWLTHSDIYFALGEVISVDHICGIQRTGNCWRLYVDNMQDRVSLLACGVNLRHKHVPIHPENPRLPKFDPKTTTRIVVSNVPLSADDGQIRRAFEIRGCTVLSLYREKLRIHNRLTNCDNGNRIVITEKLFVDFPRTMPVGRYTANVWYPGQPKGTMYVRRREANTQADSTDIPEPENDSDRPESACSEDSEDNTAATNTEGEDEETSLKKEFNQNVY